ncbi:V-type ATPase subunit [Entomospira entomophila]|uniref:V-type ATPase subunit n=1 Tax=Entomospira entomophila TaxID=2719988 RepID=A0A968G8C2_9SPIO|nr:V-type ATPase subunit [Entomospira entomophilus]NIZ40430.1 V-type ATPase subunit [Entomospira entomophilus]WDI35988.1 V-type ATPase subunit [Entomospira entomophilus]
MIAVQKYAYINARLRARLSALLEEETVYKMIQAVSVEEAMMQLSGTAYESFYGSYKKHGDLMLAEQALIEVHMRYITQIGAGLTSEIRSFVQALLILQEVRFLKTALRVWFYREVSAKNRSYLSMQSGEMYIAYLINYDNLMASTSLADIAGQLKLTPYAGIIEKHAPDVMRDQTLYSLEVALDRYALTNLHNKSMLLPATEQIAVKSILGRYIDLENIVYGKGKVLYGAEDPALFEGEFVLGGIALTKEKWMEVIFNDAALKELISQWYPSLEHKVSEVPVSTLMQYAQDRLYEEGGRRALMQYPFSSVSIVAYFLLIERDIRRIITLFNGKAYGLDETTLMSRIALHVES